MILWLRLSRRSYFGGVGHPGDLRRPLSVAVDISKVDHKVAGSNNWYGKGSHNKYYLKMRYHPRANLIGNCRYFSSQIDKYSCLELGELCNLLV